MKVGLLIYGSLETRSGGYLYDRKLAEHLERQGDRVQVVSLPWRDYARHLGDNLSRRLHRTLVDLKVDILLQDELDHPSLFWMNRRLRGRVPYPMLAIVHHLRSSELRPAWQNWLYARVERLYLRGVDGFVFNSLTTQGAVEALSGQLLPSVVAYPAADHIDPQITLDEIGQRAMESGPLRLIFVGNLIPRKGLHTLLEAVSRLPADTVCLDVVGSPDFDPGYTAEIRRRIANRGLESAVRLHGALDEAGLRERLRSAQALVLPSSYEGFGIVYLEAMGFGLPCIGSTAGAASEVILDGETGFLIPPEDESALADRLGELAADPRLRLYLSQAARQRYLAHPTWEQSGQVIRQFLIDRFSNFQSSSNSPAWGRGRG